MKRVLLAITFFLMLVPTLMAAEPAWELDFSKKSGSGSSEGWWEKNGFVFKQSAGDIKTFLKDGKMHFEAPKDTLGIFYREETIEGIKKVRITWGVSEYPKGADWEKGVMREAISFVFGFGTEKIDSGSFYMPNQPYFISVFLGEKDKEMKPYVGNYFIKGGRYFCLPCGAQAGTTVVTEVDIDQLFRQEFKKSPPSISSLGVEIDVRDAGKGKAWVEKIELFR